MHRHKGMVPRPKTSAVSPRWLAGRIDYGAAEQLPDPDASADLIWCRDVLEHVQDLEAAFSEFRRVLRPGAHAVIYQMTATEWLTPAEAARLWPPGAIYASSVDPQHFEGAITAAGLTISQNIELHGEWREYLEENGTGLSSRQLLWVSRLLRQPARLGETIRHRCLRGHSYRQPVGRVPDDRQAQPAPVCP